MCTVTTYEQKFETPEFSVKEVCDIISGIVRANTGEMSEDIVVDYGISLQHDNEKLNAIKEHILNSGVTRIKNLF